MRLVKNSCLQVPFDSRNKDMLLLEEICGYILCPYKHFRVAAMLFLMLENIESFVVRKQKYIKHQITRTIAPSLEFIITKNSYSAHKRYCFIVSIGWA